MDRAFFVTFKAYRTAGTVIQWARFYVPGEADAVAHERAVNAMRAEYPEARVLSIG